VIIVVNISAAFCGIGSEEVVAEIAFEAR